MHTIILITGVHTHGDDVHFSEQTIMYCRECKQEVETYTLDDIDEAIEQASLSRAINAHTEAQDALAEALTDELNTSAKKVSMSGGHVNKTVDSLHVPTDEEREEIVRIIDGHVDMPVSSRLVIARSILAAGFRRPAQTEPTDAVIEALTNAGRLIPEGAEVEEQYQVRWGDDGTTSPSSKERALDRASSTHGDIVEVRTIVSFTTPWREVQS